MKEAGGHDGEKIEILCLCPFSSACWKFCITVVLRSMADGKGGRRVKPFTVVVLQLLLLRLGLGWRIRMLVLAYSSSDWPADCIRRFQAQQQSDATPRLRERVWA